jgi:hypothetical protein
MQATCHSIILVMPVSGIQLWISIYFPCKLAAFASLKSWIRSSNIDLPCIPCKLSAIALYKTCLTSSSAMDLPCFLCKLAFIATYKSCLEQEFNHGSQFFLFKLAFLCIICHSSIRNSHMDLLCFPGKFTSVAS